MAKAGNKTRSNPGYVYVVAGKEPDLTNRKCTELVDTLISPEERTTGLLVENADKITLSQVLDEIRTLPFLTKKRMVVLQDM